MMQFVVLVSCINAASCPIPHGLKSNLPARDRDECQRIVKDIVKTYGYKVKDFNISCRSQ